LENNFFLFIINLVYIVYYIAIGTLCGISYNNRWQHIATLIPLSVIGFLSWFISFIFFMIENNPDTGFAWAFDVFYNINTTFFLLHTTVQYFETYTFTYIALKLLYNLL